MKIESMRSEIGKVYSGAGWAKKVKRMPDAQVLAVYYNFLKNDRFKKKKIEKKSYGREAKQLTFDDFVPTMYIGWDLATTPDCSCELEYDNEGKVRSYNYVEGGK